ncbi:hypothetical protein Pcinc_044068 [Petrolisthes cinctipes]|uniref:Uncharacterized protein n=1 Tax=Petrolisthes cinctipes TaxID=88211 RepID=A0AAE1EFQ3_PETCI|nr:hypothetical protein Pcinc_044068 [Petrolisthes cinctipes]
MGVDNCPSPHATQPLLTADLITHTNTTSPPLIHQHYLNYPPPHSLTSYNHYSTLNPTTSTPHLTHYPLTTTTLPPLPTTYHLTHYPLTTTTLPTPQPPPPLPTTSLTILLQPLLSLPTPQQPPLPTTSLTILLQLLLYPHPNHHHYPPPHSLSSYNHYSTNTPTTTTTYHLTHYPLTTTTLPTPQLPPLPTTSLTILLQLLLYPHPNYHHYQPMNILYNNTLR